MNLKNLVNKLSESIAYTMHVPVNTPHVESCAKLL